MAMQTCFASWWPYSQPHHCGICIQPRRERKKRGIALHPDSQGRHGNPLSGVQMGFGHVYERRCRRNDQRSPCRVAHYSMAFVLLACTKEQEGASKRVCCGQGLAARGACKPPRLASQLEHTCLAGGLGCIGGPLFGNVPLFGPCSGAVHPQTVRVVCGSVSSGCSM